jgi:signal transduction histidine kinase
LRILYLEDDAKDADLVQARLEADGFDCQVTRIESEAQFRSALDQGGHDLILADYTLPSFDGISALKIAVQRQPEVPFIFVSGTLDEELAIEALKLGARDYVFKTRLSRILPAVQRVLRESHERAERKRAEEALRRGDAFLAEAQALSHTGSFGWDIRSGDLHWSLETFRIFAYEPTATPTLERALERSHPGDRAVARQVIETASKERKGFDFECRLVMPEGLVKHIRVVGHPLANGQEVIGAVTDITESKLAQEALVRSQEELAHANRVMTMGELLASVAHEVNQPLSAIVVNGEACLRWLSRPVPNVEQARDAARCIVRDGTRAGQVIARIRAMALKARTEKEQLDLNRAVKDVIALTRGEMRKNGVACRTGLGKDLAPVLGDRIQLQQLLLNLIMNGIDAMAAVADRPRELAITTENGDADQVQVTVRDSGVGLDPQHQERIFDPFYTTKPSGMGMGLAISRSIVQSHGGRLWATANDGPGAAFRFTVPKYG